MPTDSPRIFSPSDSRQLLFAAVFTLGYQLVLFVLDEWVFPWTPLPLAYYAVNGVAPLVVLGLAAWPQTATVLGRTRLPLALGVLALLPILSPYLLVPVSIEVVHPLGTVLLAEGLVTRFVPILLLGLVLTAWHYRWPQVVFYCLGTTAVRVAALLIFAATSLPAGPPLAPAAPAFVLLVLAIETLGFLIIGYAVSLPLDRLRAQQRALDAAHRQLRRYAGTLEHLAASRERNRVARELHDTLAHTLSGLNMQLETVDAYWDVDAPAARALLREAHGTAQQGLHETRHALAALRARPLDDLGLGLALRQLAETAAARARVQLDLSLPEPLPPFAPEIEQAIYRVAQESLSNVIYHARAHCLAVALACRADETRLVVRDDGCGFDQAQPLTAGHFGLAGMRERAHLIGGHLTITSQPGAGTTVEMAIERDS